MVARPQPPAGRQLTGTEALMWSLDNEPSLRSSFMGITFLDRPPDPERFRRKMAEAIGSVNALREHVVPTPFDLGPPRWEVDPAFDLDYHVRHLALPPPGSRRQLLDLAAVIYADPFDRGRPLWQFTIVEGLEGGGAALLAKMHHVLSDGVGAVRLSVSFLDLTPDGDPPAPRRAPAPVEHDGSGPGAWFDAAAGALGTVLSVARNPVGTAASSLSTVRSVGRQLGLSDPARSPLWAGERSLVHRFDTLALDLTRTRAAAKALGGTVNDAFVTVMAQAAGDYHRALGEDVDYLRITMPISVRHDREAAGNAWIPARLLVPTGQMAIDDRFAEVSATLQAAKRDRSLGVGGTLAGIAQRLPAPVLARFARQQTATVDFACSNVRGAPFDLWIAGAKVLANHPLGPTAGVAFNATVLSYLESLDLGLNTDTGAITRPGLLRSCITDAAEQLTGLA